jgi:hypothetical protein
MPVDNPVAGLVPATHIFRIAQFRHVDALVKSA